MMTLWRTNITDIAAWKVKSVTIFHLWGSICVFVCAMGIGTRIVYYRIICTLVFQIPPEVRCFRYVLGSLNTSKPRVFGSLGIYYIKGHRCLFCSLCLKFPPIGDDDPVQLA